MTKGLPDPAQGPVHPAQVCTGTTEGGVAWALQSVIPECALCLPHGDSVVSGAVSPSP